MPNLPERFLKGKIAKFAEELVREFSPEDFGMSEADIRACETNPMRAFEVLMEAYTSKPDILQGAIKKIAHRMQEKIQRGELRPQDLAAEAEEIMKECTDNPQFTEMMEGFRNAFGFADMDTARIGGHGQDLVGDQPVVHHHFCGLQDTGGLKGQEFGVARSGADQPDAPTLARAR